MIDLICFNSVVKSISDFHEKTCKNRKKSMLSTKVLQYFETVLSEKQIAEFKKMNFKKILVLL